jgi:hypothetical protein
MIDTRILIIPAIMRTIFEDIFCSFSAPYLAGVLGVPEHPRNLGVHKRGEA